jgi:hypothetical protein
MRNISLTLAALALVFGSSLGSVAHANSMERQFANQRADLDNGPTYMQPQANVSATANGTAALQSAN